MKKFICTLALLWVNFASAATLGEVSFSAYLSKLSEQTGVLITAGGNDLNHETPIQLASTAPLSNEDALVRAQAVLYARGYTLLHDEVHGLYRLLRLKDARDMGPPFITDSAALPKDDRLVTFALPLKFVTPEIVARLLRSFGPAFSRFIPDEGSHTIYLTDAARSMPKYIKLTSYLDTPKHGTEEREGLRQRAQMESEACAVPSGPWQLPSNLMIALFALVGLLLGFILRGYAIRRIEGGL